MDIIFYNSRAEKNRVNKSEYLVNPVTIAGTLRKPTSVISPYIEISARTYPSYNYAYIEEFHRYYFITNIVSIRNNLWGISFSVDPLMSFRRAIYNTTAFVDRCSSSAYYDRDIVDARISVAQGYDISTQYALDGEPFVLTNDLFTSDRGFSPHFALTGFNITNGGN